MKIVMIFLSLLLIECTPTIKGKIIYREDNKDSHGCDIGNCSLVRIESNDGFYEAYQKVPNSESAYLVNLSKDKAYEFTVKEIEKNDMGIEKTRILKLKLAPGDEKWVGCTNTVFGKVKDNVSPPIKIQFTNKSSFSCEGQLEISYDKLQEN